MRPTRPTRKQKQEISALGLVAERFLVCGETADTIKLYNKTTGKVISRHKKNRK